MTEAARIAKLLRKLHAQPNPQFPEAKGAIAAPADPGVYVIRNKRGRVVYVGRTQAKGGLRARLGGHLNGKSVFSRGLLPIGPASLRSGYSFQCLAVPNPRTSALLEYLAIGTFCPKHVGTGQRVKPATEHSDA